MQECTPTQTHKYGHHLIGGLVASLLQLLVSRLPDVTTLAGQLARSLLGLATGLTDLSWSILARLAL